MNKTEQLYEGKAKKVWATEDPTIVIVDYKDDATAFNGLKKGTIVGKGVVNNKMSNYLMQLLLPHAAAGEGRRAHPLCGGAFRSGDRCEESDHRTVGSDYPQPGCRLYLQASGTGRGYGLYPAVY